MTDWMSGGTVDNDREEARSARNRPLPTHWVHIPECHCRDCVRDELGPEERP